jgi:hypothetical protein
MAQLRGLVAELEQQLPPSPPRDALIVKVRSRAVALETGSVTPSGGGRRNGPQRKRPHRLRLPWNWVQRDSGLSPAR